MKRRYAAILAVTLMTSGLACTVQANNLTVDGTVIYGGAARQLIYDSDLNITWLDYTNGSQEWDGQKAWAEGLSFTIDGKIYDNWRLPKTVDKLATFVGYDGTTAEGYNITTAEMGHLFYTELGNKGKFDTNGNLLTDYGLKQTGPFQNLADSSFYWTGTEYANISGTAWRFYTGGGIQDVIYKPYIFQGLAVSDGRISQPTPTPEPATMFLFGTGIAGLAGSRLRRKR